MTNKKYYISVFLIMVLTIGMLSLSYSQKTETLLSYNSDETIINNTRIVYSNTNIINLNNKETNISIINNNHEEQTYYLSITNLLGSNEEVLINNKKHNIKEYYIVELNPSGETGDQTTINIKMTDNEAYRINVATIKTNSLYHNIVKNEEVYKDNELNYRFYGDNPHNYIIYNNELYRIIGLINGQIKIVSNSTIRKNYNSEIEYTSLKDYLLSFNNNEVNVENTRNYSTWLNQENSFWLNDKDENNLVYFASKYRGIGKDYQFSYNAEREIKYLNPKSQITNGNGTIEEPYEVAL